MKEGTEGRKTRRIEEGMEEGIRDGRRKETKFTWKKARRGGRQEEGIEEGVEEGRRQNVRGRREGGEGDKKKE